MGLILMSLIMQQMQKELLYNSPTVIFIKTYSISESVRRPALLGKSALQLLALTGNERGFLVMSWHKRVGTE